MTRVASQAVSKFSKSAYLMRGDASNRSVPTSKDEIPWFLVDHTKLYLGHGPFSTRKAATEFGRSQGYTVHSVFPSGVFPGEDAD